MRSAAVVLMLLLSANGCPAEKPATPTKTAPQEDTSDETTLQFHTLGQLRYGKWYEAQGNKACRWQVEAKPAGDDSRPKVLASGSYDERLRIPAELPGKDVFLRFNKACGTFKEVTGP